MERRSLLGRIFGSEKETTAPQTSEQLEIIEGQKAVFTPYRGNFHEDPDVLACVDTIARNGAKMHPRHIRNTSEKMENLKGNLYKLLSKQPNEIQNAYKFYYQIISNLELYNNSIVYIQRDENLKVTGLYPLDFNEIKLYEYKDAIWIKFKFGRGKERFVPYSSCIHLTRFIGKDGLFGGSTQPILKVLDIKHVLDEGIVNAILIHEGDVLPTSVANVALLYDGQTKLISRVCEGDKRAYAENTEIGSVEIDLRYSGNHVVVTVFKLNISGALSFETYEIESDESLIDDLSALFDSKNESLVVDWNMWSNFYEKHKSHIQMKALPLNIK